MSGLENSIRWGVGVTLISGASVLADAKEAEIEGLPYPTKPGAGWTDVTSSTSAAFATLLYYALPDRRLPAVEGAEAITDQRLLWARPTAESATGFVAEKTSAQPLLDRYASRISPADLAVLRALMGSMSSSHGDPDPAAVYESYR